MKNIKNRRYLLPILLIIFSFIAILLFLAIRFSLTTKNVDNLATAKRVSAFADTFDNESLSPEMAIDGDPSTRWSSINDWDNHSHFLTVKLPTPKEISYIVINWERPNVTQYSIEGSTDGINFDTLISFNESPIGNISEIVLPTPATVSYVRLNISDVSLSEKNYYNLYQNVSIYEFELYEKAPIKYTVESPYITVNSDNTRSIISPQAPEGYTLSFIGADLSEVIDDNLNIMNTLEDKEVQLGYLLRDDSKKAPDEEISFNITVPASEVTPDEVNSNNKPFVIPEVQEWLGKTGTFSISSSSQILYSSDELLDTAQMLKEHIYENVGYDLSIRRSPTQNACSGDICLVAQNDITDSTSSYAYLQAGLGDEGYVCDISDIYVISAPTKTGIYWGSITFLNMLNHGPIEQGIIRDYPKYDVRGFGIDVARAKISLSSLYKIIDEMTLYKLNDLQIHINDNQILATSGLIGDNVDQAYSAFRVESKIKNNAGKSLTSSDLYYTTEDFSALIKYAKERNVTIVPEFDSPAHSLAITKLYPEYSLNKKNDSADQIDLSNKAALSLLDDIWADLLYDGGAFAQASTVNIGMDEYYGSANDYLKYLNSTINNVSLSGKNVRFWGSLSFITGKEKVNPAKYNGTLQMNLWSTKWADPTDMYNQGFNIINMQSNHLYIIPGGGYDYLDTQSLYSDWAANKFYDEYNYCEIPAYSPHMLGASYMIWNDNAFDPTMLITEDNILDRFYSPIVVFSDKMWKETDLSDYETLITYTQHK